MRRQGYWGWMILWCPGCRSYLPGSTKDSYVTYPACIHLGKLDEFYLFSRLDKCGLQIFYLLYSMYLAKAKQGQRVIKSIQAWHIAHQNKGWIHSCVGVLIDSNDSRHKSPQVVMRKNHHFASAMLVLSEIRFPDCCKYLCKWRQRLDAAGALHYIWLISISTPLIHCL